MCNLIIHRVSKNVPPLTCNNLDTHGSIMITFDTSVTAEVGNQNLLYFPTSPNLCLCTTWGSRKPENCVFSLKWCMLFTKSTRNTVKNITWSDVNHLHCKNDRLDHTGPRNLEHGILLSVTHVFCVSQVRHSVSRYVKRGSCSLSSLE